MNIRLITRTVGYILWVEGGFLLLPLLVSLGYGDGCWEAFLSAALLCGILGALAYLVPVKRGRMQGRDAYAAVALAWVALTLTGAFPYLLSDTIPSFVDALFETASGLTTTGATILDSVETMPPSILFWRSETQWMGGMGILVLVLALAACTVKKPQESGDVSQLPNPVHESTAEEVAEKTGITLNVPITAVDVTYSYIDGDKEPLAQVSFVYQGQTYTYRGQKTQTVQDISGMYYEWTKTTNDSEDVPYTCYFTDEGQGMALWHTDGVSYTLGMTENVTEELLVTMYGIVTGEAE